MNREVSLALLEVITTLGMILSFSDVAVCDIMHQVQINSQLPKLTRQIALDSGGTELFGQSTGVCILHLTDQEGEDITQSIFFIDKLLGGIVYGERSASSFAFTGENELYYPVGIVADRYLNSNWTYLYVADAGMRTVFQYKYTFSNGVLTFEKSLTDPGNVELGATELSIRTQDGSVWTTDNTGTYVVQLNARSDSGIAHFYGAHGHVTNLAWGRDPSNPYGASTEFLFVVDDVSNKLNRLRMDIIPGDTDLVLDQSYDLAEGSWVSAINIDGFGNLYLADYLKSEITKLSPDFQLLGTFGSPGRSAGQFVRISSLSNAEGIRAGDQFITEDWSDTTGADWYLIDVEATFVNHTYLNPHEINLRYLASDYHRLTVKVDSLKNGSWYSVVNFIVKSPKASGYTNVPWTAPAAVQGFDRTYRFTMITESTYEPNEGEAFADTLQEQFTFGNAPPAISQDLLVSGLVGGCVLDGGTHQASIIGTDLEHPSNLTYTWSIGGPSTARIRKAGQTTWQTGPISGIGVTLVEVTTDPNGGSKDIQTANLEVTASITDPGGKSTSPVNKDYGVCTDPNNKVSCPNCVLSECECPCLADPYCDGVRSDVIDVVTCVNVAFRGQTSGIDPQCPVQGFAAQSSDVDCDGVVTILDVVAVVGVAFRGGTFSDFDCFDADPCASASH